MKLLLERYYYGELQTLGKLFLLNNENEIVASYDSLELPYKDNIKRISCIPKGDYTAIRHNSPKHGPSLWLQDVPNRNEILIHKGNFYFDILGCVLIGSDLRDINGDGLLDVVNSKNSVLELLKTIDKDTIEIKIVKV